MQLHYNTSSPVLRTLLALCPSLQEGIRFIPTTWLRNGHLQTLWCVLDRRAPQIAYQRQLLTTVDGGTSAIDWAEPSASQGTATEPAGNNTIHSVAPPASPRPVLLLSPGLTSTSQSNYVRRAVDAALRQGWKCGVINHRGLSGVKLTSCHLYSAGFTGDVRAAVLRTLQDQPAGTPILLGGFSLGGNVVAKYLAEEGANSRIIGAFTFSNPFNLVASDHKMTHAFLSRWVYAPALASQLKLATSLHDPAMLQHKVDFEGVRKAKTVRDFDEAFTRRMFDYASVDDYYRDASSAPRIAQVRTPTLCLNAADDPIVPEEGLPLQEVCRSSSVVLAVTQHGGHVAHFTGWHADSWGLPRCIEFLSAALQAHGQGHDNGHVK
ncbi:hypothetical protein WJX72_003421 [[Myrmecia] bisecta]|uniref:AB hydrolase-1 domain-containing protein n=1 Tax=[Myrmecia] bisecta TaxID=41462 RepID=A0AAW1PWW1_9CHLO